MEGLQYPDILFLATLSDIPRILSQHTAHGISLDIQRTLRSRNHSLHYLFALGIPSSRGTAYCEESLEEIWGLKWAL